MVATLVRWLLTAARHRVLMSALSLFLSCITDKSVVHAAEKVDHPDNSWAVAYDLEQASNCDSKVQEWLPPIRFKPSDLALDSISLHSEFGIVDIPLKQPKGSIEALKYKGKDVDSALRFIQLMQSGKIGAVTVRQYIFSLSEVLHDNRLSSKDIAACDRSRIVKELGLCNECWIDVLNNVRP